MGRVSYFRWEVGGEPMSSEKRRYSISGNDLIELKPVVVGRLKRTDRPTRTHMDLAEEISRRMPAGGLKNGDIFLMATTSSSSITGLQASTSRNPGGTMNWSPPCSSGSECGGTSASRLPTPASEPSHFIYYPQVDLCPSILHMLN